MDKEKTTKTIEEIVSQYKKINTSIFKYGIFVILIIIATAKTRSISQQNYTANTLIDQDLEIKKTKLIGNFIARLAQGKNNSDIKTYLTLGEFKKDEQFFQSYNNLITYKGYIIPRLFQIANTMPIQPISYYEKGDYTKEEMDSFFKNMIAVNSKETTLNNKQPQLLIKKDIISDFNLQCLFQNKIYNGVCNIFTNTFIKSFFIYNIQTDIEGFKTVFNKLAEDQEHIQELCNQLTNYVIYSNTTNDNITKLFNNCPEENIDIFNKFVYFSEVQKELESKFISNKIYNDNTINIYKLISFQQIIYNDINNQRINTDRINEYTDFIQELLKKDVLPKFYKEVTYYFNNYYIVKAVENPEITRKVGDKSEIDKIIKNLNTINNGNELIGFNGLLNQINKNLILEEKSYTPTVGNANDYTNILETLLEQIDDLSIKEKIFSGNNILLKAIRSIPNNQNTNGGITNLGIKLRLQENNKILYIRQIDIEKNEELTQTINQLIQKQTWSFADLQKYMYQNQALLNQQEIQTTTNNTEDICKNITQQLSGQEIQKCNQSQIIVNILWKNKVISLTIAHENFIINNIDISDNEAKKIITEYINKPEIISQLQAKSINQTTIISFIEDIIQTLQTYKPTINTGDFQGGSNTIIIMEKVKKYLGVTLTDIAEKNNKILIQFTINNINFIGNYDIEGQKIQSLYFKDVTINNIPTLIKNISLLLDDNHKQELETFVNNPLSYIKNMSPESYLMYQKFISTK